MKRFRMSLSVPVAASEAVKIEPPEPEESTEQDATTLITIKLINEAVTTSTSDKLRITKSPKSRAAQCQRSRGSRKGAVGEMKIKKPGTSLLQEYRNNWSGRGRRQQSILRKQVSSSLGKLRQKLVPPRSKNKSQLQLNKTKENSESVTKSRSDVDLKTPKKNKRPRRKSPGSGSVSETDPGHGPLLTQTQPVETGKKRKRNTEEGSCLACGKSFKCSDALFLHYTEDHNHDWEWESNIEKSSQIQNDLQKALPEKASKLSDSVVCEICGNLFTGPQNLDRHLRDIHGEDAESLQCQQCGKIYKSKDALGAHIRQIHEGQDFRCDICNRKCQTSGKLWRHQTIDHGIEDLPPPRNTTVSQCEFCGEKTLRALILHVRKNHPDRLEEFNAKEQLNLEAAKKAGKTQGEKDRDRKRENRRKIKELGEEEARRLGVVPLWMLKKECKFCGKQVCSSSFKKHMKEVHDVVDDNNVTTFFKQLGSGSAERKSQSLKLNQIIENRKLIKVTNAFTKSLEFICSSCPQVRSRRLNPVKMHLLMEHMDSLTSPSPLLAKISLPQSETPPITDCPHCSKSFSTELELISHSETDHPNLCLKCPECSKLLISPDAMSLHFLTEHSNQNANLHQNLKLEVEEDKQEGQQVTYFKVTMLTSLSSSTVKLVHNSGVNQYRCKRCPFPSTTKSQLLAHVEESHSGNFFLCPVESCGLVKFSLQGLYRHCETSHRDNMRNVSIQKFCPMLAQNSFVPYKNLKVKCPISECTLVEMSLYHFESHLKKVHGVRESHLEKSDLLTCRICGRMLYSRVTFLAHMEEDHGHEVEIEVEVEEIIKSTTTGRKGSHSFENWKKINHSQTQQVKVKVEKVEGQPCRGKRNRPPRTRQEKVNVKAEGQSCQGKGNRSPVSKRRKLETKNVSRVSRSKPGRKRKCKS